MKKSLINATAVLFFLLLFFLRCSDEQECFRACTASHGKCMERINDAEKCGFFHLECKRKCSE